MSQQKIQANEKQVKILEWLMKPEQAALRSDWQGGKGFHVSGRAMIQPKGKAPLSITEALRQAGFVEGIEVNGYQMRIRAAETAPDGRTYAETFKFFAMRPPVQIDSDLF